MKFKKLLSRLSPSLIALSLGSTLVSAEIFEEALAPFWNLIEYLFKTLPGGDTQVIYFRFLLWVLMFAVFNIAAKRVFKEAENRGRANVISIILALMTTLLIPENILTTIFQAYGYIASFVLVFIIPIILLWFTREANPRMRGLAFVVAGLFLLAFHPTFHDETEWTDFTWVDTISSVMSLSGVVLFFVGLYYLFTGQAIGQGGQDAARGMEQPAHEEPPARPPSPEGLRPEQQLHVNQVDSFTNAAEAFVNQTEEFSRATDHENIVETANALFTQAQQILNQANQIVADTQRFNSMPQAHQDSFWRYYNHYMGGLQHVLSGLNTGLEALS